MAFPRFEHLALDPDFRVRVEDIRLDLASLSSEDQKRVQMYWEAEKQKKGDRLYNGWLIHVKQWSAKEMVGQWVEYRLYIAQLRDPSLRAKFPLQLAAVSGAILSRGSLLVGKRSRYVTLDAGCWELVPAGTLSERFIEKGILDFRKEVEKEFEEETAFSTADITHLQVVGAVRDHREHIFEIFFLIETDPTLSEQLPAVGHEHDAFEWIKCSDIHDFFERKVPSVSAPSLELLGCIPKEPQKSSN